VLVSSPSTVTSGATNAAFKSVLKFAVTGTIGASVESLGFAVTSMSCGVFGYKFITS
jgi:hypothetical protein